MQKRISVIALVIAIAACALSVFTLVSAPRPEAAKDIQYVMFLGTNDKDTNEPVCGPEEARERADAVLTRHFEGFTIQEARGGWTNEDGSVSHEYTLVILLSDTTAAKVHAAANDLIAEFHQSSVMIQANETRTEFYGGN